MQALTVSEYGALPVGADGLPQHEFDHLCRLRDELGVAFFTEERHRGRWQLRFANMVGVVPLSSGGVLEILPKITADEADLDARVHLLHLLSETGQLPVAQGALRGLAETGVLTEAYFAHIVTAAASLARSGIPKAHIRTEAVTAFVKGRLDVAAHMSRQMGRPDRHEVRYSDLLVDTPHNRVLKAALNLIVRLSRRAETVRQARGLWAKLSEVRDTRPNYAAAKCLTFTRLTAAWEPLFALIAQLLRATPPDTRAGSGTRGPTWLFDMNALFETFVGHRLRLASHHPVQLNAWTRPLLTEESGQGRFELRPDMIVGPRKTPLLILDAKWKRISQPVHQDMAISDVRQIFAYGRVFNAASVGLTYPVRGTVPLVHRFRADAGGAPMGVIVLGLPVVPGGLRALDHTLRQAVAEAVAAL